MKKIITSIFIILLCFSNIIFAAEKQNNNEPIVKAQGAVLMDFKTGRVLWGKEENKPLAMASTTKIMTAIIAIESGKINDTVTVSKKASLTPPVKMYLSEGEEIKLKNLLYALMMQSSNDAAVAIAEYVGGNVENFCNTMTEKAAQIGAKDTIFRTPNGLDLGQHHSTAYDMAVIARYALKNKEFVQIINTKEIEFKSSKCQYNIINKNRLLNEFEGAIGVKTGYTGKAGHCFVGAATRDNMTLISVVLASGWGNAGREQKWIDTKKVLNYGFENFKYKNIINKNDLAGNININKSKVNNIEIYFSDDFMLPIKSDNSEKIKIKINKPEIVEAPIKQGQILGNAEIYVNDINYGHVNLISNCNVERHDFKNSFKKILKYWISISIKCYN